MIYVATLGEAFIEIHADAGPFERELVAELEAALIKAEAVMRQHGRDAGNAYSDGVELAVRDRADDIGDELAEGLAKGGEEGGRRAAAAVRQGLGDLGDGDFEGINIPFTTNSDDLDEGLKRNRSSIFKWLSDVASDISSGLGSAFSSLGKLGSNEFTVPFLIAGITALIGAVIGLSQILNPVIALLSMIPGLLSVIGIVSLTLNAIFGTLGDQAKAVFDAKTVEEYEAAIKGLSPATLAFITLLGKVKKIWKDIGVKASEAFLKAAGNGFDKIVNNLAGPVRDGVVLVATELGKFFKNFGVFLESPRFQAFVDEIFPAVAYIIKTLGWPLIKFLDALVGMMDQSMPYLENLFLFVAGILDGLTDFINKSLNDSSFKDFMKSAYQTLGIIGKIIFTIIGMVKDLLTFLNSSGEGDKFLLTIQTALKWIADFLASKEGHEALSGFLKITELTILAFAGLFIGIGLIFAGINDMANWLYRVVGPAILDFFGTMATFFEGLWQNFLSLMSAIGDFFVMLGTFFAGLYLNLVTAATAIGDFFTMIFNWIVGIGTTIGQWLTDIQYKIARKLAEIWHNLQTGGENAIKNVVSFFSSLPGRITSAVGNLSSLLYNAGRNVLTGLIDGLKSMLPDLTGLLDWITRMIPNIKGPEAKDRKLLQPAGEAIMEGFGVGIAKGAAQVLGDLSALTGMISVNANPNTFNFGRGAIQQNFNGSPTPAVATSMGNATGSAIANTVSQQTMRAQMRAAA